MLRQLLPQRADNTYRGHKAGLWLFAVVVLMKSAIGLNSIVNGRLVASAADGIPVDTFPPAGAQTVVALFAVLGLSQLIICLLCVLVLLRYRTLIPLMFALHLLEQLGKRLVLQAIPIVRTGASPGSAVSLMLFAAVIVGFALSLWNRDDIRAQA